MNREREEREQRLLGRGAAPAPASVKEETEEGEWFLSGMGLLPAESVCVC